MKLMRNINPIHPGPGSSKPIPMVIRSGQKPIMRGVMGIA